jgi:uncharacterized protein YheU (UPF0270 family)
MMLLGDAAQHAGVAVMVWNAERRYVAINQRTCELLNTTREALLDQPVGSTNRSGQAQETIENLLEHVPARGETDINGVTVEWVVFPTTIAGLDHIIGLMWERGEI